jgi:threonyl-tRNA synthetase
VTIGPVIEDGFYYDFSYQRPFTPEDLVAIEKRMQEIAKRDIKVEREVMSRDAAVSFFKGLGEQYKAEIIAAIPAATRSRSTGRMASSISAGVRTCPPPAS